MDEHLGAEREAKEDEGDDDNVATPTPRNMYLADMEDFSKTSSPPELSTPCTPLTLTPNPSFTSTHSHSSTVSSAPSNMGSIEVEQPWEDLNKQIQGCTEKMLLRECIRILQLLVESLGREDDPYTRDMEDFLCREAAE